MSNILLTIKEKLKQGWKWCKSKTKQILIWLGIIGIVTAATIGDLNRNEVSLEKVRQKYEQSQGIKAKYQLDGASLIKTDIKNPGLDAYKHEPKDEIKITLGDKDKTEFVPNIELKRWNEVSFKIKTDELLKNVPTRDRELEFSDNKIKFKTPEMEFEMEDFAEGEGGYKFIWYLNEKPLTNKIEFEIETSGLDFFYQPPLTQEFQNGYSEEFGREIIVSETQVKDLDGNVLVERPEKWVGSYVFYHQTKGRMVDSYGKDYKTGQGGVIFASHLTDAEGKTSKAILKIENGIFSEKIPQEFLDKAVYPIRGNAEIGYSTEGGTEYTISSAYLYGNYYTCGGTGTLTKGYIYIKLYSGTQRIALMGLYDRSGAPYELLDKTGDIEVTGGPTWQSENVVGGIDVSAIDYSIAEGGNWNTSNKVSIYYNDTGLNRYYRAWTYPTFTDPITWTDSTADNTISMYFTYTPSGGEQEEEEMQATIIE